MIAFADLAGQSALIGQLQSDFARGAMSMPTCSRGRAARASALPRSFAMAALCRGRSPAGRAARAGACSPARTGRAYRCAEKGKQIIGVGVMREVLDTVSVKEL